nr:uncharacterized protein LOC105348885 isoform X1 [Crassostrea gigas]XP_034307144.1 uncharacterized protein LOC105348885 isoform X1 [Crassostrea gigas]
MTVGSPKRCAGWVLLSSVIYLYMYVHPVEAVETVSYEFGRNCTKSSRLFERHYHGYVNETRQFDVTYKGRALKYICANIGFKGSGKGESLRDEYKVCVTPIYFNDPGCAVQLNFTEDVSAKTFQTIDCLNKNVTKFCNGQNKYLHIDFEFLNENERFKANFKLRVTAEKVYKYEESSDALVYGIVGGVITALIVVIIAGVAEFISRSLKRRRRMQNRRM